MTATATLSRKIQASEEAIFRAITTPAGLLDWCANDVLLGSQVGQQVYILSEPGYQAHGRILELSERSAVSWELIAPSEGRVNFRLQPALEYVNLSVTLSFQNGLEEQLDYWTKSLDHLKSALETGLDPRVYDQPMLGVYVGKIIEDPKHEGLRSPYDTGVVLAGAIPGSGAEKAGILEGDILVEVGGKTLRNLRSLQKRLEGKKPGDEVYISWLRQGHRKQARIRLTGRPVPALPSSPAALADYFDQSTANFLVALEQRLTGIPGENLEYRPSEREWNVKEVLAHIILTERDGHLWLTNLQKGATHLRRGSSDHNLLKSLVDVLPGTTELIDELKRAYLQTSALLRRVPPEISEFRSNYMMIAVNYGEHGEVLHANMHLDHIDALIEESQQVQAS